MCSRLRPSLPHFLSLRLMGAAAPRMVSSKQTEVLSAALAFEDPSAFRVKGWGELLRALGVFRLCSFPVLVNNCGTVSLSLMIMICRRTRWLNEALTYTHHRT